MSLSRLRFALRPFVAGCSVALLSFVLLPTPERVQAQLPTWVGYGGNAQHTALSNIAAQPLQAIHWQTPIDNILQHTTGEIFIHYGAPMVTAKNTVVLTVRTSANNTFQVQAYGGYAGEAKWTFNTDYTTPPSGWIPSCGAVLAPDNSLVVPAAGGTVYRLSNVDRTTVSSKRYAFYGLSKYIANPTVYNSSIFVDTPITCDKSGNIYFGFQVTGANPALSIGGLARISSTGVGTWVSAATASGDPNMTKVANNCTPAISNDGTLVYVAVNSGVDNFGGGGYLVALDSKTLATKAVTTLIDPKSNQNADVIDDGTASPLIGPDDDVYYGVLETPFLENNDRGWLLHFDKMLTTSKTPGAFGWDDTGSIVPASAVPSYTGTSSYLVLTKYNRYADFGLQDGENRVAILDPNAQMTEPYTGTTVMQEVITVLGKTMNTGLPGVREWCINSAAVDPQTKCAIVNSEDGTVYRWDFTTNSLLEGVVLTPGVGEAYTPTVIGPDGASYAINDAVLFSVGASNPDVTNVVKVYRYGVTSGSGPNTKQQLVKIVNNSNCQLPGPISLVLDNLSANATLINASGTTQTAAPLGSSYITLTPNPLNNGQSYTVTLKFQYSGKGAITYTPRVLCGPGSQP